MVGGSVLAFFLIPSRLAAHAPADSFCDPCSPPMRPTVRSAR
jgi:hypothetical protein